MRKGAARHHQSKSPVAPLSHSYAETKREFRQIGKWPDAMSFTDAIITNPMDDAPWRHLPSVISRDTVVMDQYEGNIIID